MARVNKCRVCLSTDPESGWAGTNHNLCNECVRVAAEAAAIERARARAEHLRAREEYERANPEAKSERLKMLPLFAGIAGFLSR